MSAVSNDHHQGLQLPSSDRVSNHVRKGRAGQVDAVYEVFEGLQLLPTREAREQFLRECSAGNNVSPERWAEWCIIPARIPRHVLEDPDIGFARTPEGKPTWCNQLTWSHLLTAAEAGGKKVDRYSPEERVSWLVTASDEHMNNDEFEDWLRKQGVIQTRQRKTFTVEDGAQEEERINRGREAAKYLQKCLRGDYGPHVQERIGKSWARKEDALPEQAAAPTTVCTALIAMCEQLRAKGQDIDLTRKLAQRRKERPGEPISAPAFLEWAAGLVKERLLEAEFTLPDAAEERP